MKTVRIIWAIFATIAILGILISALSNVTDVQSAMQASQLYDEASMELLVIIAFTLLLNQRGGSEKKPAEGSSTTV